MRVNCCRSDNTVELATCGLGASCAGSCTALGAFLCPSGNCSGDCEISLEQETTGNCTGDCEISSEQETNQIEVIQDYAAATKPSWAFKGCPRAGCPVWQNKGCCYHPTCRERRSRTCSWLNYLTGKIPSFFSNFACWGMNYLTCTYCGFFPVFCELTITFQGRLAHCQAVCPMAIGLVRCRRFQSAAPHSWTKMHSHTRVSLDTFVKHIISKQVSSLKPAWNSWNN